MALLGTLLLLAGIASGVSIAGIYGGLNKTHLKSPTTNEPLTQQRSSAKEHGASDTAAISVPRRRLVSWITASNARFYPLFDRDPRSQVHPIKLVQGAGRLFMVFRGDAYSISLGDVFAEGSSRLTPASLTLRKTLGRGRIREFVYVQWHPNERRLYALDKSNDVYVRDDSAGAWHFMERARPWRSLPDPHYVALWPARSGLYLLDYARNQLWHRPSPNVPVSNAYFKRDVPSWMVTRTPGAHDLTQAVDMIETVDGVFIVLDDRGWLHSFKNGAPTTSVPIVENDDIRGLQRPLYSDLAILPRSTFIHVADAANGRVLVVQRRTGQVVREVVLPVTNGSRMRVHALCMVRDKLFMIADNQLVMYPRDGVYDPGSISDTRPSDYQTDEQPGRVPLCDPRVSGFQMPIPDLLPDNVSVFPGARRLYRRGIHEGVDFFDRNDPANGGRYVAYGSSVYSAKEGKVLRADHDFVEMSAKEHQQILATCELNHETSRSHEQRFRGRQVWLEHEDGIVTVYAHLSSIVSDIIPGRRIAGGVPIGAVGNSGTSAGVARSRRYPHLHFEIWLNGFDTNEGEYLGRWLPPWETKRLWEELFPKAAQSAPPVK